MGWGPQVVLKSPGRCAGAGQAGGPCSALISQGQLLAHTPGLCSCSVSKACFLVYAAMCISMCVCAVFAPGWAQGNRCVQMERCLTLWFGHSPIFSFFLPSLCCYRAPSVLLPLIHCLPLSRKIHPVLRDLRLGILLLFSRNIQLPVQPSLSYIFQGKVLSGCLAE